MKGKRKYIYLFIGALIALYLIIYVVPSVTGWLSATESVEPGTLQVSEEVTCYFVRDEKVYTASSGGKLKYLKEEGGKVSNRAKIAQLTPDGSKLGEEETSEYKTLITELDGAAVKTETCISEFSGVVSYMIDGYEDYFTPEKMDELEENKAAGLNIKNVDVKRSSTYADEPIYKVCSDQVWYILFWGETGSTDTYEEGDQVIVSLNKSEIKAQVHKISESGGKWKIILRCKDYYEDFAHTRRTQAQIVTGNHSGLIVSRESITTKDGKSGVYVKQKDGDYKFVRVNIEATDGEESVVTDTHFYDEDGKIVNTVEAYDEIKKNPKEGT